MKNNLKTILVLLAAICVSGSCKKYLDTLPDTCTELNTVDKVLSLLATAYPQAAYQKIAEIKFDF